MRTRWRIGSRLANVLELRTDAPLTQVRQVVRWAERACHVVNTFREPVDVLPNLPREPL